MMLSHTVTCTSSLQDGYNPLATASFHGRMDLVDLFLCHNADVNMITEVNYTPHNARPLCRIVYRPIEFIDVQ